MNCIKKITYVIALLCMTTGAAWGMNIFQAAKTGNIGRIEELLASGADINRQGMEDMTALHWAANNGFAEAARMLIEAGANINQQDDKDRTALHYAARTGHANIVRMLIEAGANVNQQDQCGWTALHDAAFNCCADVICMLIEAGIDINQQDNTGKTALDVIITRQPFFINEELFAFHQRGTVALLKDYQQRMEQARQRAPVIAHTLALATHKRLGAASPLAVLPQELLHYITRLTAQAEAIDARRPRQIQEVGANRPNQEIQVQPTVKQAGYLNSWCIIS